MRNLMLLLLALAAAAPSHAASFDARLHAAYDMAAQGGFDEAVTALEELKIDYPEQPTIDYLIGSVRYRKGEGLAQAGDPEAAQAEFDAANKTFTGLSQHADERLAIDASFGRANVLAQQAKMLAGPETFKEGVQALRNAEQAYVELLKRDASHAGARQNLDHVRLILKQLLQNKPEEQENEEQEESEDPPPQVKVFSLFRGATTQVPDASAVVDGDTVRLQRQGGGS